MAERFPELLRTLTSVNTSDVDGHQAEEHKGMVREAKHEDGVANQDTPNEREKGMGRIGVWIVLAGAEVADAANRAVAKAVFSLWSAFSQVGVIIEAKAPFGRRRHHLRPAIATVGRNQL